MPLAFYCVGLLSSVGLVPVDSSGFQWIPVKEQDCSHSLFTFLIPFTIKSTEKSERVIP